MCRWIAPTGWACSCQIRPNHAVPRAFLKPCGAVRGPGVTSATCPEPHMIPVRCKVPWFCPQCHDELMQNHLRPPYGVAGSTQSSVMSRLDVLDQHREILQGADIGIRNRLETNLQRLDQNVLLVARQLNTARDAALEGFLGTELFIHKRWSQVMESGQQFVFLGFRQFGLPAMLTEAEKASLPTYEDNLIPSALPVLTTVPADGLPSYLEVVPHNLLDAFKPLDCQAKDVALVEGQSSASSDNEGDFVAPLELLTRLCEKLFREFKELQSLEHRGVTEGTALAYSAAQQAQYGILAFGSAYQRRHRRQQLRHQLRTASILILEETLLKDTHQQVVGLRTRIANGTTDLRMTMGRYQKVCGHIVNFVYTNRYTYSLSKILIPLNATDNSRCHAISLMPDSHRNMRAPRVFGFPGVEQQLVEYTNRSLIDYWIALSGPRPHDPYELPLVNDDTDSNGNVISFGALGPCGKYPHNAQDPEKQKFRPVESLKCIPVDRDPEAPNVRVLRKIRQGVSFELIMPSTPDPVVASGPDTAIRRGSAPAVVDVAYEVNRDGWDRVVAVAEQLSNAARAATHGDSGIHEETISLADILSFLRARQHQTTQLPGPSAPSASNSLGPLFLGLPSAPVRGRIEFDTRARGPDAADISTLLMQESTQLAAENLAAVHNLRVVYGWQLGECLNLALQLDGMEVNGSDNRIMRLRELLTGSYLPMRPDDARLSQFGDGTTVANRTAQENSNDMDSSGGSASSMDNANNEDVEMGERKLR